MQSRGIPLSWALRQSAGAVAAGVSQASLFERCLIEPRYGDDRDGISPAQYVLLCMNTAYAVEDAAHGLGTRALPARYSAAGIRVMLGCATLGGGLQAVAKLYSMASPTLRLHLHNDHDEARLIVRCDSPTAAYSAFLEDNYLSWMFMHCTQFLGRPMPLTGVTTRDPGHVSLGSLHYAIKAPVRFGGVSELRFPKELLIAKRSGCGSDEAFWDCMRPWLEFVESDGLEPQRVNGSALRLDVLARQARVSQATMRRRMAADGGIRRVRQRALADAGVALLQSSDASVETIAERLGYADAGSFRRFLKAATGKTPSEIRQEPASIADSAINAAVHERVRRMCLTMDRL